jgi:dynein heavy chain
MRQQGLNIPHTNVLAPAPPLLPPRRQEIFNLLEADIPQDSSLPVENEDGTGFAPFSVRQLMEFGLLDHMEQVQTISGMASKEYR